MALDIFRTKGTPLDRQQFTWQDLVQPPYSKLDDDAFTRVRVILMNGIESEAVRFGHACARMNGPLQRALARVRRLEQHQQTLVNWLNPADQSALETTIAYEQVAIEVTASVAQNEPDPYLAQVYRFGLLEDFDHLYRYSRVSPSSRGSAQDAAQVRIEYATRKEVLGTMPPPVTNGAAKAASAPPALLDKLGERLAFERSADPTAVTPSADLHALAARGLPAVLADPRTTLQQCLEAMSIAELVDNDCWENLRDLAAGLGEPELAGSFEDALAEEREHLSRVRLWTRAALAQSTSGRIELKIPARSEERRTHRSSEPARTAPASMAPANRSGRATARRGATSTRRAPGTER